MAQVTHTGARAKSEKQSLLKWKPNERTGEAVTWGQVEANVISLFIDAVSRAGNACIFGKTQDGGALSLVVLTQYEKIKEYPHNAEDATDLLIALTSYFVDLLVDDL